MSFPAVNALYDIQVLLNDQKGNTYHFHKLLPFMQMVYRELGERLQLSESAVVLADSGPILVPAGILGFITPPDNIILPLYLEERSPGSVVDYTPMEQRMWGQNAIPGSTLSQWNWREEVVNFVGSSADREVRMIYLKSLGNIPDQNTNILVSNARNYIAAKTAQYVEAYVKQNYKKAAILETQAEASIERVLRIATKGEQAMPVRKLPYGTTRRILGRRLS